MRKTTIPNTPLGRIIWEFRGTSHLSKRAAAEVLDISYVYINSLEAGVDIRTGNPFKPRKATLRQLAAKMTEFGYPMTFEQLLKAAGLEDEEEKPESASRKEEPRKAQGERPALYVIDGELDVPDDVPDPPDEWELDVLRKTGALGSRDYSKESDFWYLPREDRRALLRHLEDIWFEDQRLRKKMAERRG